MNSAISVVIPAFNEERAIEDTLSRTYKAMESIGLPYEIILVDDGSTDMTTKLAYNHKVTVLKNGRNQGKGHALHRGFLHANGDIIVVLDADGSHKPEEIAKLLVPVLNGADFVLGSRFVGGNGKGSTRKLNIFGNKLINVLIRVATSKSVTDSQSGFRAYKKKVLRQIEITSKGYQVETEMLVKALRKGVAVQEVPVAAEKRRDGSSHLSPLRDGYRIFKAIIHASINP